MREKNKIVIAMDMFQILFTAISIGLISIFINENITISYIAVLLMLIANVIFCLKNVKERIMFFLFNGAFFTFLMGREFINLIEYGKVTYSFSTETQTHIILCLYLSLISLQIGYVLLEHFFRKQQEPNENIVLFKIKIERTNLKEILRRYAKLVFIIGWILNLFVSIEQIIYVFNHSYVEFASSFVSRIPYIIRIVANLRTMAFFLFLATIPEKKQAKPILILYAVEALISLLFGDRGNCIIDIFIIIFYIVFRQWKDKHEKWVTKRQVIAVVIMIPFVLGFLSAFVYFREGTDVGSFNLSNQIMRFFKSIGNSVNIIGYEKAYETELHEIGSFYTLGDIKQYVLYNPITTTIFNIKNLPYYTQEYALSGQSLMHSISYFINPTQYLAGHGYGSCYIAELHIDFGYIGVIIGNMLLGAYMAIFYKIYNKSYILTGCLLLSYRIMFFIPRAPIDYLLTYILNFTAIVSMFIIIVFTLVELKRMQESYLLKENKDEG